MVQIDKGCHPHGTNKNKEQHRLHSGWIAIPDPHRPQRTQELDQRIAYGVRQPTIAAAAAPQKIAKDRNVVIEANQTVTLAATRWRSNQRHPQRQTINANIEKTAAN